MARLRPARGVAVVALAVASAACASVGYQPYDDEDGAGYWEREVGPQVFFVEYVGARDRLSVARAGAYVRRRCAELALGRRRRFVAVRQGRGGLESTLYSERSAGQAACVGTGLGRVGLATCRIDRGRTRYERRRDRVVFRAQCELLTASRPGAFDARALLQR